MKLTNLFSIREAARMANMTTETLRHYDRIGLVTPHAKDEWTGYRYYSRDDVIRLHTVHALRCMDLSLREIKAVLEYDSLEKIVGFLKQAEKNAEDKIAGLQYAKSKIRLARQDYEKKLLGPQEAESPFTQCFDRRVILLSATMQEPTLDNLWNYHSAFFAQLPPRLRDSFVFADLAGIYTREDRSRLFAVCIRHGKAPGLETLPAGRYLCANCGEDDRAAVLAQLKTQAQAMLGAPPAFTVQQIVISGILQWNYQLQIYLGPKKKGRET